MVRRHLAAIDGASLAQCLLQKGMPGAGGMCPPLCCRDHGLRPRMVRFALEDLGPVPHVRSTSA